MSRFTSTGLGWLAVLALSSFGPQASAQEVDLPQAGDDGPMSLERAIAGRHSVRSYTERGLELEQIGQLLWAALGITVDGVSGPTRAAPSAGGLYPLRAYVVVGQASGVDPGVYRYAPERHRLERLRDGDVRDDLARAALGQRAVGEAPCVVVLGADYEVTRRRYGERGAERYVHMDAGHAAQNVLLQAVALGLGAAPIGAFDDAAVARLLRMDTEPLYLIPVGYPRGR
ncbi:MAG: SagB/ThcOx family dehydrogenase [Spirochaetota bacterium]